MEDDCEYREDDRKNQGASRGLVISSADGEQTNKTELGKVYTDSDLVKSTAVEGTLGVDLGAERVEEAVAERQVQQEQAEGSETKDQRSDDRI